MPHPLKLPKNLIDNDFALSLQIHLQLQKHLVPNNLQPLTEYKLPTIEAKNFGKTLLAQGKVGSLILAGGDGTRLNALQPKALIPITAIQKKTVLQQFCEKIATAEKIFNSCLPIAVMSSHKNHSIIADYLEKNKNFGVSSLSIFTQNCSPLIVKDGQQFLEIEKAIATAPNGNGEALPLLTKSGITEVWKNKNIQYVTVIPIDNPLANPFDPTLCGHHALNGHEATIKTIIQHDHLEKMGVLVKKDGKIAIQEYFELPENFLTPVIANIGLFCFSLSFIEKIQNYNLPWHFTSKTYLGKQVLKGEKFIFDVLSCTNATGAIVYPREDVYAPIKNTTHIQTAQSTIENFEKRLFQHYFPNTTPPLNIELSPSLYYR